MAQASKRGISLPIRIALGLFCGVVLGLLCRAYFPAQKDWLAGTFAEPVGAIFLNMMFLVIIPLIFSSLALGVAGLGDLKTVGRLGLRILLGTIILTGAGVFIGIGLVNVLRPGERVSPEAHERLLAATESADATKRVAQAKEAQPFAKVVPTFISRNPVEDMANLFTPNTEYKGGGIIAFIMFTFIVGVALTGIEKEQAAPIIALLESIQALSMKIISFAMELAPFGVAALIFKTTATVGVELFQVLGLYMFTVLGALAIQLFGVYSLVIKFGARRSPLEFFKAVEEVIVTAFSTSSSNATLPTTLRVAQENLRLNRATSSFVLTVGSTANQNGTALFEGITILFLAQFYGIHLDFGSQVTVVLMSILAGIGTAGVPGGSIPLIAIVLAQVGIPPAGIGIILGVDRLLDMSRTVINVVGDMVLATLCDGVAGESQVTTSQSPPVFPG